MGIRYPDLPIVRLLPQLRQSLSSRRDVVLSSPPGSGKTSCAPLALLDEPWTKGRQIVLLEPRRVAARAAAWRMSEIIGEEVGVTVGYQLRLERKCSSATRIMVMTEGLLSQRMLSDPELKNVACVIFDEFHERSIQADLALALCRDVQRSLRDDLRIVFMSATISPDELVARHTCRLDVIESAGRQYPVETIFLPHDAASYIQDYMASGCLRALHEQQGGVLAFLPGEGEIRATLRALQEKGLPSNVDVHPLYGALSKREQDAALRPPAEGRRKLVLATSIAESSLTIDSIYAVVDCGLMRVPRFDASCGMPRLETLRETRDRADQRRGRAGRLPPGGVCYRMWDAGTDRSLAPSIQPEVLSADLADVVLAIADWGVPASRGLDDIPWQTRPPEQGWGYAADLLRQLGAIDSDGCITKHGRAMAELPIHPRLANMVVGAKPADKPLACKIAAALSEQMNVEVAWGERITDLGELLYMIDADDRRVPKFHREQAVQLARRFASMVGARSAGSRKAVSKAQAGGEERSRILFDPRFEESGEGGDQRKSSGNSGPSPDDYARTGELLALAYPDRIGRKRPGAEDSKQARYLLTGGRGCILSPKDALAHNEWIVVAEVDGANADAAVRLAAALPCEWAERDDAAVARRHFESVLEWDSRKMAVVAAEKEMLGAITLRERPLRNPDNDAMLKCLCDGIRQEGIARLNWTPAARQLQARLALVRKMMPNDGWPAADDESLAANLEEWLGDSLGGVRTLAAAAEKDLCLAIYSWIGYKRQRELESLAPTHCRMPSGHNAKIDYADSDTPAIDVKIQDAFGLKDTPAICGGRVKTLMRLLSPARRPVQITSDLASFWKQGYFEVRKDLRARYPKHRWPEDPANPDAQK